MRTCILLLSLLVPGFTHAEGLTLVGITSVSRGDVSGGTGGRAALRSRPDAGGPWLLRFVKGVGTGLVEAVPNFIRSVRERPLTTLGVVGGLMALGFVSAPAALLVGGGLLAYGAYQTRGDPTELGKLTGEVALFGGLGWGAGRAFRALRAPRPAGAATVPAAAGSGALEAGATRAAPAHTVAAVTEVTATETAAARAVPAPRAPAPSGAGAAASEAAPAELLAIAENGRRVPPNVRSVDGYYGTSEYTAADIPRLFREGMPARGGTNMNLRDHVLEASRTGAEPTAFRSTAPYPGMPEAQALTPLRAAAGTSGETNGIILHVRGAPGWTTADLAPRATTIIPGEAETVIMSRILPEHIYEILTIRRSFRDPDIVMIDRVFRNPLFETPPAPVASGGSPAGPSAILLPGS